MKKLKYFLVLLLSLNSIITYAIQHDNGTGPIKNGSTWYSTIVYGPYDIQDGNNLDINLSYPSNHIKFDCYRASILGGDDKKKIEIQQKVNNSWSVFYTYLIPNKNTWNNNIETNSLNSNATDVAFRRVAGDSERSIRNIYVKMAPHTKMNTTSISFLNVPLGTKQTQTIDFYSFLSGSKGIQIYAIDNNGNKTNIEGLTFSINNINANECEKINENNFSIILTFNPQSIFSLTNYKIRIVNSDATIGNIIDIPFTNLSSALNPPTLKCITNAYDYVTLSWNKIDGATSYNIYDNNIFVKSVNNTNTTITDLIMGSNHKFTVTSIYGSSISNHSNVIDITTHSYPKITNLQFTNIKQNSFTINWDKVELQPNHNFNCYKIHIYYYDYYDVHCTNLKEYSKIENITNINQTSYIINNVDDATKFYVNIGVDFNYTLNNETKYYDVSKYIKDNQFLGWTSDFIETKTTYNNSSEISNGIYIYKGEWHYINVNIDNELYGVLLSKQWPFYYPQENLKYRAWVESAGNVTHYVNDDATGREYKLTGTNYGYPTYDVNNKLQTEVLSIDKNLNKVIFTGRRDPFGGKKIYVGDVYSKIARHILLENDTINIGNVKINNNVNIPIKFKSFLVDNELKVISDNNDFIPNKTIICDKATNKSGTFCQLNDRKYDFNINFIPSKEGEQIANITVTDGINSKIITIISNVFQYNTFITDGEWTESDKWSFGLPSENDNIIISANVIIPNNITIKAKNVILNDSINITIKPQGILKIDSIKTFNNSNIIIESNDINTGTFLFLNKNKVNATIQLYSKASSDGIRNNIEGNFKDPKWQYIGIITDSLKYSILNTDGITNWIYKWDETQNMNSCWSEKLNENSYLYAWKGYCIAQKNEHIYTYKGYLLNKNHIFNLTYTNNEYSSDDLGNNLITNSYSGPIDITSLNMNNFNNAEATIYIYNTGSYVEWKTQSNTEGFNPGQTIAIPINTISVLGSEYPRTIPSSQAFFIKSYLNGGQFIVDYEKNIYNAKSINNQKRIVNNNQFNVLKINVKSNTSNDRLYLIEHQNGTPDFNNGYDAIKIFDNNGPQIFAINDTLYTSINTNNTLINQYIGFKGVSEYEIYTITFETDKLYTYEKLYLYDIITNEYVDILNNESYTFYHIPSNNDVRFLITTQNNNNNEDIPTKIETISSFNEINLNDIIYIYNINGQLIYNSKIHSLNNINNLSEGIYIIVKNNKIIKLCVRK